MTPKTSLAVIYSLNLKCSTQLFTSVHLRSLKKPLYNLNTLRMQHECFMGFGVPYPNVRKIIYA